MLEENYKSASQGERKEILEKLAVAEVKMNEAQSQVTLKDDEIQTLKKEIDNLRERVKIAYAEKDMQTADLEQKLATVQATKDEEKSAGDNQWQEELQNEHAKNEKLTETIKILEEEIKKKEQDAVENENQWKARFADMDNQLQNYEGQDRASQGDAKKELDEQKMEYERMLQEKEAQRQKQKNEWAEVFLSISSLIDLWEFKTRNRRFKE